jgi:hypothetical protein
MQQLPLLRHRLLLQAQQCQQLLLLLRLLVPRELQLALGLRVLTQLNLDRWPLLLPQRLVVQT